MRDARRSACAKAAQRLSAGLTCYCSLMATRFRIGTASWTDPGFIEDWYPPKLPKSQLLRYYAEHLNYVEVNATFTRCPWRGPLSAGVPRRQMIFCLM